MCISPHCDKIDLTELILSLWLVQPTVAYWPLCVPDV